MLTLNDYCNGGQLLYYNVFVRRILTGNIQFYNLKNSPQQNQNYHTPKKNTIFHKKILKHKVGNIFFPYLVNINICFLVSQCSSMQCYQTNNKTLFCYFFF